MNIMQRDLTINKKEFNNYTKIFLLWIYLFICTGLFIISINLLTNQNILVRSNSVSSNNFSNFLGAQNSREKLIYFLYQFQEIILFFVAFLLLLTFLTKILQEQKDTTQISTGRFHKLIIMIIALFTLTILMSAVFLTSEPSIIINILIGVFIMSYILKGTDMEVLKIFQAIKKTIYIFSTLLLAIYIFSLFVPDLFYSSILFPLMIGLMYILLGIILKLRLHLKWNSSINTI